MNNIIKKTNENQFSFINTEEHYMYLLLLFLVQPQQVVDLDGKQW